MEGFEVKGAGGGQCKAIKLGMNHGKGGRGKRVGGGRGGPGNGREWRRRWLRWSGRRKDRGIGMGNVRARKRGSSKGTSEKV